MENNRFLVKFNTLSNSELDAIITNTKSFVFEARFAAAQILKNRNTIHPMLEELEQEDVRQQNEIQSIIENIKKQNLAIVKELQRIAISKKWFYNLSNGNVLQVKRINEKIFEIQIKSYRSEIAPVMICLLKKDKTFITFPFFNIKSILIIGILGTLMIFALLWYDHSKISFETDSIPLLLPILFAIGIQILTLPIYFLILSTFRETLGSKS
jgi:hypothetical protein